MNRFIYLTTVILFCISFSGCEKEETKEFIDFEKRQKCSETFFRSSKTKSTDDFTVQVVNYLKYIDDRTYFTEEFVETYGRPWWDISKTAYTQNIPLKIVPIIDIDEIHISGLLFFGFIDNEFESFFILNDECAIRTLKNDQMHTLYSNLILNYERVLSKRRLKEVRVVDQGDCFSTYVDDEWIKTECDFKLIDWTPTVPQGPTGLPEPGEPGGPSGPIGPDTPLGPGEPIGPGGGGGGGGGGAPKCKYIDGKWVCPIEVPEELLPKLLPEVLPTEDFFSNEKLNCIWNKINNILVNNNSSLLTSIFANFSGISYNPQDIIITVENNLVNGNNQAIYGNCGPDGNNYLIKLNGSQIENRASIEIFKTILHEMLHAHLKRMYNTSPDDFTTLFSKHIEVTKGVKLSDHDVMKNYYIPQMINALKAFDKVNGLSDDEFNYEGIILNGLDALPSQETLQHIIYSENYFRNRNLNCEDQ